MGKNQESEKDAEPARSFGVFLSRVSYGDFERECSGELKKLMSKLREEAAASQVAKGALMLKLEFELDENGELIVRSNVSVKEPQPAKRKSTMWVNKQGNVVFENPRQQGLPFREVNAELTVRELAPVERTAKEV